MLTLADYDQMLKIAQSSYPSKITRYIRLFLANSNIFMARHIIYSYNSSNLGSNRFERQHLLFIPLLCVSGS